MRRRALVVVVLIVLVAIAVFGPPLIQINSFRRRITDNIGAAIGRPVSADSVQFELVPRPAIVLSNFVVAEEPTFGVEPMLQAPSVTAQIRLRSLWRGQLRVARISLESPSLNLTHCTDGRWSLQNLLTTAVRATNAQNPNGEEEFPYIEASGARVNLKEGTEKTPFSLEDVDLAWSRDSARRWRMRLKGRPVRTDIEVGDTGILRAEGTFLTAPSLDDVQVELNATWNQLQMGQLTQLAHRVDAGWRGDVGLQASVQGAIRELNISTRAQVFGIRRTEFVPATSLDPVLTCDAKFGHASATLQDVSCILPIAANGSRAEAHGTLSLAAPIAQSTMTIDVDKIPAASLLEAARHARQNLAQNVQAEGEADGSFTWDGKSWRGEATLPQLNLLHSGSKAPIVVDDLRIAVGDTEPQLAARPKTLRVRASKQRAMGLQVAANSWRLDPAQIDMGGVTPLIISATATRSGYTVHWKGSAQWSRLALLAEFSPGLRKALPFSDFVSPSTGATVSDADLDLTLHAPWFIDAAQLAQVSGTLHTRNLRFTSPLLAQPVDIPTATAQFGVDRIQWSGVARYGGARFEGEVTLPARCPADEECTSSFAVRTQQLDLGSAIAAESSLSSSPVLAFLERLRPSSSGVASWPSMTGSVHIGTFTAGALVTHDADALLDISHRTANVRTMTGRALGGALNLDGQADAEGRSPKYRVHFKLSQIDSAKGGALFHENWSLGSGDVEANLTSQGSSPGDLAQNVVGDFRLDLKSGVLRSATASLPFDRFNARGTVGGRKLTIQSGTWVKGTSNLDVNGTVGFDRGLQMSIGTGSDATVVSGTIAAPVISKP